jgi:hypothetical protein
MKTTLQIFRGNPLLQTLLILVFAFSSVLQSQDVKEKIVYPSKTIVPNDADLTDPVNFGLFQATPVGDVNGDGFCDMVYNVFAGDERTPELDDWIRKSFIVYNNDLSNVLLRYESEIYGVGDFNGDGIDDFLDNQTGYVYYGSSDGIPSDSLFLGLTSSSEPARVWYVGDINGDSYSDFMIITEQNYSVSYTFYSGPDPTPIPFNPNKETKGFTSEGERSHSYDYDSDGIPELCFSYHHDNKMYIKWFTLDKDNAQINIEYSTTFDSLPSRTYHTQSFADINGDGFIDICTAFYAFDSINGLPSFNLEVFPGISSEPYFDDPVIVEMWNSSRLLYFAGDFNGDGAEDLYSKTKQDSIVVYYGNPDVFSSGFQKVQYYSGIAGELFPKTYYLSSYDLRYYSMPKFYYNNDTISDLFFNYYSYDENLRFNILGTAIVTGGESPDFENPLIIGKEANQTFYDLAYGIKTKNVGDINNDGYDDLGVLAEYGCYLDIFYGGEIFDTVPDVKFMLPQISRAQSGDFTSGDINGDGWTDIIISNYSDFKVGLTLGVIPKIQEVYVFFGGPSMQSIYYYQDADYILNNPNTHYSFAQSISVVGDFNADGTDDLVIGGNTTGSSLRMAFLYFGGEEFSSEPDMRLTAYGENYSTFALPVTACGDVNGDGNDDIMLGDPYTNSGKSLIYFGGADADSIYDIVISSPSTPIYNFGLFTTRNKGDFDGDGFFDIVHYNSFKDALYLYKGGPEFDNISDVIFFDSVFMNNVGPIEFIDRTFETGNYDLFVGYRIDYKPYLKLYNGGPFAFQDVISFDSLVGSSFSAGASGDFNNDGLTEIFVGFPYEATYGWPRGGIVKMYVPANYVYTGDDENTTLIVNDAITVYPNPVTSEMNVEFVLEEPGMVTFTIFDITGKSIMSDSGYFTGKSTKTFTFDPGISNDGLYILEIKQKGSVVRKKFVFQNN